MPFPEARVLLLEEGGLLGGDLDGLARMGFLERQPAVVARAEAVASGLEPVAPRWRPFRIFWRVIEENRTPSSASIASKRLQP